MYTILKSFIDTLSMAIIKTKNLFSKLNFITLIMWRSVRMCCNKESF